MRLERDEVAAIEVEVPLSVNATTMDLQAIINCEKDQDQSNNTAQSTSVNVIRSRFPQPSGLENRSADPQACGTRLE